MSYLGWFDDNPKRPTAQKIDDAIAAYVERFKTRPSVVLVNAAELVARADGITVRAETYIRRNNYWVGRSEA